MIPKTPKKKWTIEEINQDPKEAVLDNWRNLEFVLDQTQEICLLAMSKDVFAFKYVKDKNIEITKSALNVSGLMLKYVENQTDEIIEFNLTVKRGKKSRNFFELIKGDKSKWVDLSLKHNPLSIKYIPEEFLTRERILKTMSADIRSFRHLPKNLQFPEICEMALVDSANFPHVVNKTKRIIYQALSINPKSIKDIKMVERTPFMWLFALRKSKENFTDLVKDLKIVDNKGSLKEIKSRIYSIIKTASNKRMILKKLRKSVF